MELIVMLVVAFPLGYFIRNRMAAYVALIAVHSFVFSYQCTQLLREWVAGDYSVFSKQSDSTTDLPWAYLVVNILIYAAGFGLTTAGHAIRARRRARTAQSVDLGPL